MLNALCCEWMIFLTAYSSTDPKSYVFNLYCPFYSACLGSMCRDKLNNNAVQIYVTYVLLAAYIFLCLRIFFCALEPNVMTLYRSDFFYYSKIWNGKQYPLENVILFKMEMEFFAIWHLNTLQQYLSINSFDERCTNGKKKK